MRSTLICKLVPAVAVLAACTVPSSRGQTSQPARPVSLAEVGERGIEGRLGAALGTIVEIAGKVVPNTSNGKMYASTPFFLKIESVDERPLKEPVLYEFTPSKGSSIRQPKIGDAFRFVGYETGSFVGSPEGEFDYVGMYATTSFGFRTRFEILSADGKVKK